jgi:hypothetical protein
MLSVFPATEGTTFCGVEGEKWVFSTNRMTQEAAEQFCASQGYQYADLDELNKARERLTISRAFREGYWWTTKDGNLVDGFRASKKAFFGGSGELKELAVDGNANYKVQYANVACFCRPDTAIPRHGLVVDKANPRN